MTEPAEHAAQSEGEPFWNLTNGVRVPEPVPGLYADICAQTHHVYDDVYGPLVCARCGHKDSPPRRRLSLRGLGLDKRQQRRERRRA